MPIKPFDNGNFPNSIRWMVTVRIIGPLIDPAMTISLSKSYSGSIQAIITTPAEHNIISQIGQIVKTNPNASIAEVADRINMTSRTLDGIHCPALIELADAFEGLSIHTILPNKLMMDPTSYRLLSQSQYGNYIQVDYHGPGADAQEQDEPMIEWVERLRKLIERACK